MAEETIQDEETVPVESALDEDEFDRLRRKSTLASSVYDDMELDEEPQSSSAFSGLTPAQIIILLILLVIDILAIGALVYWIVTGNFF